MKINLTNKILYCLLWIIMPLMLSAQCRVSDSLQLVALYKSTNGANWKNNTNWLTPKPINTWFGE